MQQPETTRWSLVARAADPAQTHSAAALAELCAIWRPAVLAFLRRKAEPAYADDLTQGFFLHFIECGLSGKADPARGRFRSFLYQGLHRWWIDQERARHAEKRGGRGQHVEVENLELFDPADQPEAAFDREWATCLLREGMRRLRDEAGRNGRMALFDAAAAFLIEEPDAGDYARGAAALGMRPNTFAVAVTRLRKRLQSVIRDLITDTAIDGQQAADELRHLRSALRQSRTVELP